MIQVDQEAAAAAALHHSNQGHVACSSSASSSSLYIIGASSPLDAGDTDDDASSGASGTPSMSVAERFASSIRTQESLDAIHICKKYTIPKELTAILPAGDHRASSPPPPPGAICAGMRFPLHPFFCVALAYFGVRRPLPLRRRAAVSPLVPALRTGFRGKDSSGALLVCLVSSRGGRRSSDAVAVRREVGPTVVQELYLRADSHQAGGAEEAVAAKLLGAHGAAVDLKTYLSEKNLAAAVQGALAHCRRRCSRSRSRSRSLLELLVPANGKTPVPGSRRLNQMIRSLLAAKPKQASGKKVTVKSKPGSDTQPLSGKKRKLMEDATKQGMSRAEPNAPLDNGHGACSQAPLGFSAQKTASPPTGSSPPRLADQHDGDIGDWEAARKMLQSIVAPPRLLEFSAAKPSDVIRSSDVTMFQAANRVSFSLGYALELEEKVAAREREAEALRRELAQAKAELAGAKEASAEGARSAAAEAVQEFLGSPEHELRLAEKALAGYKRGMDGMKRAALRRYPHLDPDQLHVTSDRAVAGVGLY
ncbi:hypothetical protein HU200_015397 [Digitaria exilis]|uniref:Uncharacterized protein n=1 Tax=Digitaria exilis TaxID=1010633 RepID=A0A835FBD0_9POAL|nr:hypothetical protein HU200_015397 [Digitaria exilis]